MTAGVEKFHLRRALVVTQVALCLVLLVGALLFVRTLRNLMTTEAGFRADGVVAVDLDLGLAKYPKGAASGRLSGSARSAGGHSGSDFGGRSPAHSGKRRRMEQQHRARCQPRRVQSGKESFFNRVGVGYFRTMGIGVIAGREFNDRDSLSGPKVAIVNEVFARKFLRHHERGGPHLPPGGRSGKTRAAI